MFILDDSPLFHLIVTESELISASVIVSVGITKHSTNDMSEMINMDS